VSEDRAWGWVAHLRAGGTTPWSAWRDEAAPAGRVLPGAQQLELLRRLNEAGSPSEALVERVLVADLPGRGRPELPLLGADGGDYGPVAVDPGELGAPELLRPATTLLAEDLAADHARAPKPRRAWRRPRRLPYRLAGDPWVASAARAVLRPANSGRVLVLGGPLEALLADVWAHRCLSGSGARRWSRWLQRSVRLDALPRGADTLGAARRLAALVGRDRVTVVLDPALVPGLLRLPPVERPSGTAIDLARRTGPALASRVGDRAGAVLRETLLPRVGPVGEPPVGVPDRHAAWLADQADRQRDGLLADGYPVLGDPDRLGERAGGPVPAADETLRLALRLLLTAKGES